MSRANGFRTKKQSIIKPLWLKDRGKFVEIPYHLMRCCEDYASHNTFYYIDAIGSSHDAKDFAMQHPRFFKPVHGGGWLVLRNKRQSWLAHQFSGKPYLTLWFAVAMNVLCGLFNLAHAIGWIPN